MARYLCHNKKTMEQSSWPTPGFLQLYHVNVNSNTYSSYNSANIRHSPPANMEMIMIYLYSV